MAEIASQDTVGSKKRNRSKNFSPRETEVLVECLKNRMHLIEKKFTSGEGRKQQQHAWVEVQLAVNAVGVAFRSVHELKEKWRNMLKKGKKEFSESRASCNKTGGGCAREGDKDKSLHQVIDLMKGTPSFSGISGSEAETIIDDALTISDYGLKGCNFLEIESQDGDDLKDDNATELTEKNKQTVLLQIPEDAVTVPFSIPGTSSNFPVPQTGNSGTLPGKSANVTNKENAVKVPQPTKSNRKRKTLREVQMEYYQQGLELQREQLKCYSKFGKLADVLIEKFSC